jgi:hypothetical protein
LPQLTDEEEEKLDQIIDRFIDYDTGKLPGSDGKQALKDFQKLGPEAIPALIRGLNRAAKVEHSCPAVTIAKKLSRMFRSTKDAELLEFARENIGAGIERSVHMNVLKDLRVQCMLRKRALAQMNETEIRTAPTLKGDSTGKDAGTSSLRTLGITELVEAAGQERGPRLKLVLRELGRRRGDAALGALGSAAATYEGDVQKLARELLTNQLSGLSAEKVKERLKDDRAEVRAAAARVIAKRGLHLEGELIERLLDETNVVRQAAHEALVKVSKGSDFGPKPDASESDRHEAVLRWRSWLDRRNGR